MPKSGLEQLSRDLTDQGKLIEAGWIGLRIATIPAETPPEQLAELRNTFFSGARYLFAVLISILDPQTPEPTPEDLQRMDQIDSELKEFIIDYAAKHLPTKGTA